MRPIRIYVFHKVPGIEWITSVHRDFDEAVSAVELARTGNDGVCFVHVGISRPSNQDFEPIVAKTSNCVLLTTSARWAFEGAGKYSSAVASVGKLRLHLALEGWGTVSDDARTLQIDIIEASKSPWFESLQKTDKALAEIVRARGVVDDITYFENEKHFTWEMKQKVGLGRMLFLMNGYDHQDPFQVVRACPPWLMTANLSSLDMTARCANALRGQSLITVSDLVGITPTDYMRFPNMGKKTVADLAEALWKQARKGPPVSSDIERSQESPSTLGDRQSRDGLATGFKQAAMPAHHVSFKLAFASDLNDLPEIQRAIINKRIGIGGEPMTLQDLAEDMDVTRERIRQIESKGIQAFKADSLWDTQFLTRLARLIDDRDDPLPVASLGIFDPWFEGIEELLPQFRFILSRVSDGAYSILKINGCEFLTKLPKAAWDQAVKNATDLLERSVGSDISKNEVRILVQDLLAADGRELASELWSTVQILALFAPDQNGIQRLIAMGTSADSLVAATLAGSDRALHYTEIPGKVEAIFGRKIELRRAHAAAANQGILLGRGTFGVARHYPLSSAEKEILNAEAAEIIASGPPDRQWSCAELVRTLANRELPFSERIDQYVLNISLHDEPSVSSLGRLVWTRSGMRSSSASNRIDVMQAVIAVLINNGEPMTRDEIRRALLSERGLSDYFQLNSRGSLVRVSADKWGVSERDIFLSNEERKKLRDHAEILLTQNQSGIHSDELIDALSEVLPKLAELTNQHALSSILLTDERFRTSIGGYIYLQGWDGPRRMSRSEAIAEILRQAKGIGLRASEIAKRATILIGREIDKASVYAAFRICGAKFDEESGTWRLAEDDEEYHQQRQA